MLHVASIKPGLEAPYSALNRATMIHLFATAALPTPAGALMEIYINFNFPPPCLPINYQTFPLSVLRSPFSVLGAFKFYQPKSLINIFQLIFICCRRHFFVLTHAHIFMPLLWASSEKKNNQNISWYTYPHLCMYVCMYVCMWEESNRGITGFSNGDGISFMCFTYFFNGFPLVSLFEKNLSRWHTHCQAHSDPETYPR